jgi:hypothetical protein
MIRLTTLAFALPLALATLPTHAAVVSLGTFNFDSNLFGNTLVESDGGTFRSSNWLNVVNADPGNPAALTGPNFDTGIANIGLSGGPPQYIIGYTNAIVNGAGDDLAIVSARYSVNDTFRVAVSTDGVTFSGFQSFGPGLAQATGVNRSYFYNGGGPFGSQLFVTPMDLSAFGVAGGGSIVAVQISGAPEADLIRVAGFGGTEVPEPSTYALFAAGLTALLGARRLRRS